jgi:hypothetical protein
MQLKEIGMPALFGIVQQPPLECSGSRAPGREALNLHLNSHSLIRWPLAARRTYVFLLWPLLGPI